MSTENSQNTTAVEEKQQPVDQELEKMRREAQNLDALATQLQSQKRFAEAFDFYNKSRNVYQKIGDKEAAAQQLTHMAYLKELLGEFEASLGHYQESKELFRETNNKEDFAEVTDRIAKTFYREKKYEEAIKEYTDAIEFGCQGGDLFNNTGFIYITLNKIKEALPYLEKAREIRAAEESEFLDISINNLGTAAFLEDRFDEARSFFLQALEANKRKTKEDRTIQFIVFALGKEKNTGQAPFECYNDVMTRASEFLNLAAAQAELGDREKALQSCEQAHSLDPDGTYLSLPSAWIYQTLGDSDRALHYFKRVLSVNPGLEHIRKVVDRINPFAFEKVGRNEACPCGSGVKFKKCHGKGL